MEDGSSVKDNEEMVRQLLAENRALSPISLTAWRSSMACASQVVAW